MRSLDALGKCGKGLTARGSSLEENMKAQRQKEHSTGQSLQSEHGVSGEAVGTRKESHYKVFCKVSADVLS